ncbi:mechanosensitive ion channel family protein [Rubritalea profundi]|uniref:mechanosensitive ion channel family protein n=1 Tax=Rubritalea profundi TaxID=1658618 RepID=UPI000CF45BB5|nr:mechanosensitive ion channel domain-containing protein [Rubritalea profundi]
MVKMTKFFLTPRIWVGMVFILCVVGGSLFLGALNYINPVRELLDSDQMSFWLGGMRFSAFMVIKNLLVILVLFWVTSIIAKFGKNRIRSIRKINSNSRSLLAKAYQAAVYFTALLIGLQVLGIDFTGLAIFSGAIGIGVGFGLQKITSNFISGLIILFEKSINEGDLIEMNEGLSGFVRETGARYTLVETFEGREVMIPNEDFITNRVTSWTFSSNQGRISIDVGVSYDSDLNQVSELILEAANENPRCSQNPAPECFLVNFGDSSVDFTLNFWVDDIAVGRRRPRSDVLFSIWKKFKDHDIQIPFPQRDVHMITPKS